jgi:hypothetical protein
MIDRPCAFRDRARWETAMVADSRICATFGDAVKVEVTRCSLATTVQMEAAWPNDYL